MKSLLPALMVLMVGTAWSIDSASAEGNCPLGFYPIGGQGVQGCAPIPGANTGATERGGASKPRMRYADQWGAIAFSETTSDAGDVVGRDSEALAESEALRQCGRNGARDCKMILKYRNQCAAWVMPSENRVAAAGGLGTGSSEVLAVVAAKKNCVDPSQKGCHVVYSACSLPVLVRG
ncbi:DUF4189 domain-containing protein [Stenotrophomonas pavanii]|uniref:DUF4189 domain-containing protein n=2 Tax=Stenotrophomonas pavanii TaxID=487698 RepID=UPI0039C5C080